MGAYLVHPYEKEQKLKSTVRHVKKIPNERLVKHRETGINIKTKDARMNKNEKMEHYPETIPYYQLIDYLDAKAGDVTQFNSATDLKEMAGQNCSCESVSHSCQFQLDMNCQGT